MRSVVPLLLIAAAGCTAAPPSESPMVQAKAQAKLNQLLAGKVAGEPQSCLPSYRANDMTVIDDYTILFKEGGTVYVQKPRGGCYGIGNGNYTLVTRIAGSNRLCSGQIGEIVDRVSGYGFGSCVFGDFVPYRKPS